MNKKIVINFKKNQIITYGDIQPHHIELARAKLHCGDVKKSKRDRFKRFCRKVIRCVRFAASKSPEPRHYMLSLPVERSER